MLINSNINGSCSAYHWFYQLKTHSVHHITSFLYCFFSTHVDYFLLAVYHYYYLLSCIRFIIELPFCFFIVLRFKSVKCAALLKQAVTIYTPVRSDPLIWLEQAAFRERWCLVPCIAPLVCSLRKIPNLILVCLLSWSLFTFSCFSGEQAHGLHLPLWLQRCS